MLRDFREGRITTLIGTSVLGEGVDLPCAETLILASGGKAESQVIQNVGRVLRNFKGKLDALIIDFDDRDEGTLEDHSDIRFSYYEKYFEMDLDD